MIVLSQVRCTEMVEQVSEVRSGQSLVASVAKNGVSRGKGIWNQEQGRSRDTDCCTSQTRPIPGARLIRYKVLAFQKSLEYGKRN